MTYQEIRAAHVAGSPPGADPQRPTETFEQYKARMKSQGLLPDIDVGESDADYLVRLATYNPSPIVIKDAVYASNVVGTVQNATSAALAIYASAAATSSYISSSRAFDAGKVYVLSASYAVSTGP